MFPNMVMSAKQKIINYVSKKTLVASDVQMEGEIKQIEIKNRTYYFYNDIINLKNFDSNLLKIDKKHYKKIDIHYIGYIII